MFEIMKWKGTTGEWAVNVKNTVSVKDTNQSICSTWLMDASHLDERNEGESWLSMRDRTKKDREILHDFIPSENTRLIVDAGNTIQKCDLLPSELLQQRDELLEALKGVTKLYVDLAECGDCGYWNPHEEEPIANAEELIKKHDQ
jgi:hypothetical protein